MRGVAVIQPLLYLVTENAGSSSWPNNRKKCDNGVRYLHRRMRLGMLSGKLVNEFSPVCTVGRQTTRWPNCDMLAGRLPQITHPCCDQSGFHLQNEQRSNIALECICRLWFGRVQMWFTWNRANVDGSWRMADCPLSWPTWRLPPMIYWSMCAANVRNLQQIPAQYQSVFLWKERAQACNSMSWLSRWTVPECCTSATRRAWTVGWRQHLLRYVFPSQYAVCKFMFCPNWFTVIFEDFHVWPYYFRSIYRAVYKSIYILHSTFFILCFDVSLYLTLVIHESTCLIIVC